MMMGLVGIDEGDEELDELTKSLHSKKVRNGLSLKPQRSFVAWGNGQKFVFDRLACQMDPTGEEGDGNGKNNGA
jgi:hypothetical protein